MNDERRAAITKAVEDATREINAFSLYEETQSINIHGPLQLLLINLMSGANGEKLTISAAKNGDQPELIAGPLSLNPETRKKTDAATTALLDTTIMYFLQETIHVLIPLLKGGAHVQINVQE